MDSNNFSYPELQRAVVMSANRQRTDDCGCINGKCQVLPGCRAVAIRKAKEVESIADEVQGTMRWPRVVLGCLMSLTVPVLILASLYAWTSVAWVSFLAMRVFTL